MNCGKKGVIGELIHIKTSVPRLRAMDGRILAMPSTELDPIKAFCRRNLTGRKLKRLAEPVNWLYGTTDRLHLEKVFLVSKFIMTVQIAKSAKSITRATLFCEVMAHSHKVDRTAAVSHFIDRITDMRVPFSVSPRLFLEIVNFSDNQDLGSTFAGLSRMNCRQTQHGCQCQYPMQPHSSSLHCF
jgi:hypothetical protein